MNKILFDLSACQPNRASKFHGGGVYGKIVFQRLVELAPSNIVAFFFSSRFIDPSKFKPTLPTLEKCLTHFISNPTFLNIDWDKTARRDRHNNTWMPYDRIPGVKKKVRYTLVRFGFIQ